MDFDALKDPFPYRDIEWRIARAGKSKKGVWAKCFAYVTARAIMDRLDDVCGPGNWQIAYESDDHHLRAGIGILTGDGWIWKWDGTGLLDSSGGLSKADAGKGDHSLALKRAGVLWGIGRYLYNLPEGWAKIHQDGAYYQPASKSKDLPAFNWDPPVLPAWARPGGDGKYEAPDADPDTGEVTEDDVPPEVELKSLRDRAVNAKLIDTKGSKAVDDAIREGDADKIAKMRDRLTELLDNAPETEKAA